MALAALDTSLLIDTIRRPLFIGIFGGILDADTVGGTFFGADAAANTPSRIDNEAYQFFALAGAALFVVDMLKVLFTEIL